MRGLASKIREPLHMLMLSRSSSELAVRTEGENCSLSASLAQATPFQYKAKTDCKVAGALGNA